MNNPFHIQTHARLRTWLAIGYALFIAYASLSPFTGWRNQGLAFGEVLAQRVLGLSDTPHWMQRGGGLVITTDHVRWSISGMTPTSARALAPVLAALAAKIGAAAS